MNVRTILLGWVAGAFLSACGGGSNSTTAPQGVSDGNTKFAISNHVTQNIARAKVITNTTGTTLYDGAFSCDIGNTCVLAINANTQEPFQIQLSNAEGDLVAAWASEKSPASFTPVNASLQNLGAHIIREATKINGGDAQGTLIKLSNYLAAKKQTSSFNLFNELGQMNNDFTQPTGSQTQESFHAHLADSVKNTTIGPNSASSSNLLTRVMSQLRPMQAIPPINCGAGSAASVIQQLSGVVGALGDKIPVPGIDVVASGLNKILGDGCDNTFNQLNAVLSELSDISNQLNALQLGQQAIEAEIQAMSDQAAKNAINQTSAAINTAINAVYSDINQYNSFLNQTGYASLSAFFKATGGINNDSFNPTTNKYATQLGGIKLLNSMASQQNNFYALGLADNYQSLSRNLDTVCATANLPNAQGDIIQLRKMCNAKIISLIAHVSAYATAASVMLNDELATLRQYNVSQILDPIGSNAASDQQGVTTLLSSAVGAIANNFSGGAYGLLDGFPSSLVSNLSNTSTNCFVNVNGTTLPAILEWYPNTNTQANPGGPHALTHCYSGYDYKYANFVYQNVSSVRNVMGVLINADSTHGLMLNNMGSGFNIGGSLANFANNSEMANGNVSDTVVMPAGYTMDVYNPQMNDAAYFCSGNAFCAPYNGNTGYPNGTYTLANSAANQLASMTPWQPNCSNTFLQPSPTGCYSGMNFGNTSKQTVATIALTDSVPDAAGRKRTYLFDLYLYSGLYGFGSLSTQYANAYYMVCVTPDCSPAFVPGSGGVYSLNFANGARAGGRGPALGIQAPDNTPSFNGGFSGPNGSPATGTFTLQ